MRASHLPDHARGGLIMNWESEWLRLENGLRTGDPLLTTTVGLLLLLVFLLASVWIRGRSRVDRARREAEEIRERYRPIVDVERAAADTKQAARADVDKLRSEIAKLTDTVQTLKSGYLEKRAIYDRLMREISVFEDKVEFAELGMYRPPLKLGSSMQYAAAIERVRDKQKAMIAAGTALVCPIDWFVDNSAAKGRAMTNRNIRMTLRAFNNECEVLINKTTWKNYESIRERILRSKAAFDKLNESNRITITSDYVNLKLEELQLVYEEAVKKQEEQDKLREAREKEREEAKAQRELHAEMRRAEKREQEREEALSVARSELATALDAEKSKFEARVRELEEALAKARDAKERAMSMAQQTKVGYVYIISNVGSFGEQVFKIGMTRRLEPLDRVRELGDASVPFPFDVHALIFTDDAPSLERELHLAMEKARVNLVNTRKEFFRASGDEVAKVVRDRFPNVVYLERPQSQEYLASLPREALQEIVAEQQEEAFPVAI